MSGKGREDCVKPFLCKRLSFLRIELLVSSQRVSSPTITRSTHSLLLAAHENTGPNYRKDVLQMLDMLT